MADTETFSQGILLPGQRGRVNTGQLNSACVWRLDGRFSYGTIQSGNPGVAWPTGTVPVLTFEISNDGLEWFGIPDGAVTMNAKGISEVMVVRAIGFIRANVSTKGATDPVWMYLTFVGGTV